MWDGTHATAKLGIQIISELISSVELSLQNTFEANADEVYIVSATCLYLEGALLVYPFARRCRFSDR